MKCTPRSVALMLSAALLLAAILGTSQSAHLLASDRISLSAPVACSAARRCSVQNFVDVDPGEGALDFTCGPLTYDDHGGVDIRVPSYLELAQDVEILAAADGTVRRIHDGIPDNPSSTVPEEMTRDSWSGNYVLIEHRDGWYTVYGHLRAGSILVRVGERLERGQPLGAMGLSGRTEFPHLHFGVFQNEDEIDPYTGLPKGNGCGAMDKPLWDAEAQRLLAYQPGGLLSMGFTLEVPDIEAILHAGIRRIEVSQGAQPIYFYVLSWGLRTGDEEFIVIEGPDGQIIGRSSEIVSGDRAQRLRYIRMRRTDNKPWPSGQYWGSYRLERPGPKGNLIVVAFETPLHVK